MARFWRVIKDSWNACNEQLPIISALEIIQIVRSRRWCSDSLPNLMWWTAGGTTHLLCHLCRRKRILVVPEYEWLRRRHTCPCRHHKTLQKRCTFWWISSIYHNYILSQCIENFLREPEIDNLSLTASIKILQYKDSVYVAPKALAICQMRSGLSNFAGLEWGTMDRKQPDLQFIVWRCRRAIGPEMVGIVSTEVYIWLHHTSDKRAMICFS